MKAFLLTRFADIGFVLGIVALAAQTGTTRLALIFEHFGEGAAAPTAALVLMLIGIAGKSGSSHSTTGSPTPWRPDPGVGAHPRRHHGRGGHRRRRTALPALRREHRRPARLAVLAAATTVYTAVMAFTQNDVRSSSPTRR